MTEDLIICDAYRHPHKQSVSALSPCRNPRPVPESLLERAEPDLTVRVSVADLRTVLAWVVVGEDDPAYLRLQAAVESTS